MVSRYTEKLINAIQKAASVSELLCFSLIWSHSDHPNKDAKEHIETHGGKRVVTDIWPFVPTMFDNSSDTAWPHYAGQPNGPVLVIILWEDKEHDDFWVEQLVKALDAIRAVALEEQCTTEDAPVYQNTALDKTSTEEIYRKNLSHLILLREKVDPNGVMDLTGGFRIPLPPK